MISDMQTATTIEQSRRLMEAGYGADTADMKWSEWGGVQHLTIGCRYPMQEEVPAWSFSALWGLVNEKSAVVWHPTLFCPQGDRVEDVIEGLVQELCYLG